MEIEKMTKVTDKFISGYLNGKVFEAIKPLNEIKEALAESEQGLITELDEIIKRILRIEV